MAYRKLKLRLGELLVSENIITEEQLEHALQMQNNTYRKLGDCLIDLGYITERKLLEFLAKQLDVPFIDISKRVFSPQSTALLSEVHARRLRVLILEFDDDNVLVGMSDPADLSALDQLKVYLAPRDVEVAAVSESQLFSALDQLYRRTADIASFASQLEQEQFEPSGLELTELGLDESGGATVVKLLKSVFEDAVQMRASDVHIEPEKRVFRIRQRIDGFLQENVINQPKIASALVLKLKLMANLDISEKRLPQDGRFHLSIKGQEVDVRLSTMPVQYGESVVMRLLNQSKGVISLDKTGLPLDLVNQLRLQISRPHGMVLVTGPTGSGKTTTLYAALTELNHPEKKIITVEDPIEYRLERINQVQVNRKIDLDFARVLRSALRQDPDIIMIGEMRDSETVDIALRAAITGHMVLSTLHTNDAIASVTRLIDMGAMGYLVSSALRAIVAQRLIRRICVYCKTEQEVEPQEKVWLENLVKSPIEQTFYTGSGCQSCNYTGYHGRIGVFELLELDEDMIAALKKEDAEAFSAAVKASKNYQPLALTAYDLARKGLVTVAEVLSLAEAMSFQ
ncbi:GspE/PulE family protein [Thalassotalea aquiviva]|uniref:GspE/PulE family protein n=1 Tax=Thalassotalea aquiviva TaxID=3242415 RepID=UPI00352BA2AA